MNLIEPDASLLQRFQSVRAWTRRLCAPLCPEDFVVQSMPDVSPTKWHLAHTSWFFETFLLCQKPDYHPFHPQYAYLFNSYYNSVGRQFARAQRGLLSRPTVEEVWAYRDHVNAAMERMLQAGDLSLKMQGIVEVGLHHEQQHQELLLTDIKHVLSCNPLAPVYRQGSGDTNMAKVMPLGWQGFEGGMQSIGHAGDGFCFDNELPQHPQWLPPFELSQRLVTEGDMLEFIADDGYQRPELWLSEGWGWVQREGIEAPLYWSRDEAAQWQLFSLSGRIPLQPRRPIAHVSYYEADAYARWVKARLPREQELEVAARDGAIEGNFVEKARFQPRPAEVQGNTEGMQQLYGDVWEWTQSPYTPYPGYCAAAGALGEYNGKFMCNQLVLRGGSCVTAQSHMRASYRNFFPAHARWQFSGFRLARDVR